jgi:tetratricopeptide (TPR) repeat protein
MATISEALAIAIQHHQAGRLEAAERIYRQILAAEPNQADAWHLLGVMAHQSGKDEMDAAVAGFRRALELNPDFAAAHLAGALGVPVWVALPFVPDWRWLLDRCESPWYPTMRLFRQKERGNWQGVFQEIEQALGDRLPSSRNPGDPR